MLLKDRFLALSATIPNIRDVADWLGADQEGCKSFSEDFRPVKVSRMTWNYN